MSAKRVCALILFLAAAMPAAAQPPAAPPPPPNPPMTSPPMGPSPKATVKDGKTLYQRIGGYDAIAKTVDAFLPNLIAALPKLGTMATGLADASKVRNRQMIVDQICMLTGGPCIFVGRPNDVTHQGLQITQEDWDKSQGALAKTLDPGAATTRLDAWRELAVGWVFERAGDARAVERYAHAVELDPD